MSGIANGVKHLVKNGAKNGIKNGAKNGVKNGIKNGIKNGVEDVVRNRRIAASTFRGGKIQGPKPIRSQLQTNRNVLAANREEAIMQHNSDHWTDSTTGQQKQVRNYGAEDRPLGRPADANLRRADQKIKSENRKRKIDESTEGEHDFYKANKLHDESHHVRGIDHWAWLFQGLNKAETGLFHNDLAKVGIFTGDKLFNRADLPKVVHDVLHGFMRANGFLAPKKGIKNLKYAQRKKYVTKALQDQSVIEQVMYAMMQRFNAGEAVTLQAAQEASGL